MNEQPCSNIGCEAPESIKARHDRDIVKTKELRVQLDGVLQNIKEAVAKDRHSRERALAVTKVQEAIMWLGMDLKDIGTPTPYPNSYNPSNTIVDATADGLKL